ncbi:MAG TPA: glycosyltransferase [Candidatus Limnocylindrales bacterium]|nr:glycosyltransferase [Candidatus Limnocylindrales bacterium]
MAVRRPLRLTYVHGRYPVLTETFIDREIEGLLARGVDLAIFSIRPPDANLSPAQRALSGRVRYLLPPSVPSLVLAGLSAALGRPRTFFGTLAWLLRRPHPPGRRVRSLLHFATGVYLAWLARDRRGVHLHAHFIDRAAIVAYVASRFLDATYSVTAHATEIYVEPVLLPEKIERAAFVVTCTDYNRRHLAGLVGPDAAARIVRIYHGLPFDPQLALERAERADPPLVLAVGQLQEKKGLRYLVEACRVLADRGRRFRCEIVGDGPVRAALERRIDELGLAACVTLAGRLSYPEVVARYREAAVFALPSIVTPEGDRDGIPNVILEAMAAGVPVVSTPVSGIPEVVRDGGTGLLVPERDPTALADAIERLLDDEALADRLGHAGQAFVRAEFDIERSVERLLETFERFAGASR